jgi:hypothetical protein
MSMDVACLSGERCEQPLAQCLPAYYIKGCIAVILLASLEFNKQLGPGAGSSYRQHLSTEPCPPPQHWLLMAPMLRPAASHTCSPCFHTHKIPCFYTWVLAGPGESGGREREFRSRNKDGPSPHSDESLQCSSALRPKCPAPH